jgi:hypothetical protein
MHYPECAGLPRGVFLISARDEQGARAIYGSPGRLQPVDAVAVTYRYAAPAAALQKPFRARGGTAFVAVLRGEVASDNPDLFVGVGTDPVAAPTCRPQIADAGVPETCRVTIEGGDRDVFVTTQGGGFGSNLGLTVVYVPAGG